MLGLNVGVRAYVTQFLTKLSNVLITEMSSPKEWLARFLKTFSSLDKIVDASKIEEFATIDPETNFLMRIDSARLEQVAIEKINYLDTIAREAKMEPDYSEIHRENRYPTIAEQITNELLEPVKNIKEVGREALREEIGNWLKEDIFDYELANGPRFFRQRLKNNFVIVPLKSYQIEQPLVRMPSVGHVRFLPDSSTTRAVLREVFDQGFKVGKIDICEDTLVVNHCTPDILHRF